MIAVEIVRDVEYVYAITYGAFTWINFNPNMETYLHPL